MLNISLTQNVQITQSYYVKLTLGYVKFNTKFQQVFNINTNVYIAYYQAYSLGLKTLETFCYCKITLKRVIE